ncbi:DUF937 domain-containing protein [Flavobacterium sp. NG2]|uniref:DUF937 domain-containing protein n=1 Tax=Flavobacterium sp. NG2 TaxID=3097547 RepID=UPI002A7F4433|nr:DUF937 domain-containing protein [Flavobacterium sp. NG2]WPR70931.1 DUF937 domain-containing protein [Flavobacterium sp. NG2]
MFEQLTELAQQFGVESVIKNNAVPKEKNEAVIGEASHSIVRGLQKIASEGGVDQLANLFQGNNADDKSNIVVQKLSSELTDNLAQKFGLSASDASGIATKLIPQIISALVSKAKDPNDSSFQISDIIGAISGGNNAGIMDAINKYGGQFGLDQNGDGNIDLNDAMDAVSKKSGLGGMLGGMFGK